MSFCLSEPTIYFRTNVVLDKDRACFPYKKFWRGNYQSSVPIVLDRQAGYYPRNEEIPKKVKELPCDYPQHCFETSPATRYPCYPECTKKASQYRRYLLNDAKHFLYR